MCLLGVSSALPRTAAEADSERRAREGMVPDAAGPMAGNDGHGGHGDGVDGPERLFDLKTLHWGVSTYEPSRARACRRCRQLR